MNVILLQYYRRLLLKLVNCFFLFFTLNNGALYYIDRVSFMPYVYTIVHVVLYLIIIIIQYAKCCIAMQTY